MLTRPSPSSLNLNRSSPSPRCKHHLLVHSLRSTTWRPRFRHFNTPGSTAANLNGEGSGASGGAVLFPYPAHPHPTPHQIFHLSVGASQGDIKARYYDLVRQHHPDSPQCRHLPPQTRHARFQSISAAYDYLTGKGVNTSRNAAGPSGRDADADMLAELARRRHAYGHGHGPAHGFHPRHQYHRADWADFAYDSGGSSSSSSSSTSWKDADTLLIVGGALSVGVIAILGLFGPLLFMPVRGPNTGAGAGASMSPSENLARAREEAREWGMVRRSEIRKRVEESQRRRREEEGVKGKEDVDVVER